MCYDTDVSKVNRDLAPHFYGFVPDGTRKKAKVFLLLLAMSSFQLSMKVSRQRGLTGRRYPQPTVPNVVNTSLQSIAYVLCSPSSGGGRLLLAYVGGELAFFLLYVIARRDFDYWLPITDFCGAYTTFLRIAQKCVLDFTLLVHLRHPFEASGAYWLLTGLCLTPTSFFYFASRYLDSTETEDMSSVRLNSNQVYLLVGGLFGLQLCTLVLFLSSIKRYYIPTFYSLKTATKYTEELFLHSNDDETKLGIFQYNRTKWKAIGERGIF